MTRIRVQKQKKTRRSRAEGPLEPLRRMSGAERMLQTLDELLEDIERTLEEAS
jgi:hypothetical protein